MVSKRLVIVHVSDYAKNQKAMCITLTPLGTNMAEQIMLKEKEWVERMEIINQVFGLDARNERIEKYIRKEFPELVLGIKGD